MQPKIDYPKFVRTLFKTGAVTAPMSYQRELVHAVMGVCGEFLELQSLLTPELSHSEADMLAEAGDIFFYAQAICNLYDKCMDDLSITIFFPAPEDSDVAWNKALKNLLEDSKKCFAYDRELPSWENSILPNLEVLLGMTLEYVYCFTSVLEDTVNPFIPTTIKELIDVIIEGNIKKLSTRYPQGFSNEAANARVDMQVESTKPLGE